MEDIIEIQQLLNRYSISSSRGDVDDIAATYAEDGVWNVASMAETVQGHAAIRQALTGFTSQQEYLVQQNAPGLISVEGDSATATSVICEKGKFAANDHSFEALGFYVDRLVRTAAGWRFKERTFELVNMRSIPAAGR
jgi:ketosteroid isomerase-like protein